MIGFIINATLARVARMAPQLWCQDVSGSAVRNGPFPGSTGGRIFYGERKDGLCLSVIATLWKKELLRESTGLSYISLELVEYGRHVINFGKLWIIAKML